MAGRSIPNLPTEAAKGSEMADIVEAGRALLFMRHGETEFNRRKVRCGGDVDIPLTELGEAQARAAGKGVSVCGEMAGDPAFTELLLAMGEVLRRADLVASDGEEIAEGQGEHAGQPEDVDLSAFLTADLPDSDASMMAAE